MQKINYNDKIRNNGSSPSGQWSAENANEVKRVVNQNALIVQEQYARKTDIIKANAEYVDITSTALPQPAKSNGWTWLMGGKTYTQNNGQSIAISKNKLGVASYNGSAWTLSGEIELPDNASELREWTAGIYDIGATRTKDGTIYRANKTTNLIPSTSSPDWDTVGGEDLPIDIAGGVASYESVDSLIKNRTTGGVTFDDFSKTGVLNSIGGIEASTRWRHSERFKVYKDQPIELRLICDTDLTAVVLYGMSGAFVREVRRFTQEDIQNRVAVFEYVPTQDGFISANSMIDGGTNIYIKSKGEAIEKIYMKPVDAAPISNKGFVVGMDGTKAWWDANATEQGYLDELGRARDPSNLDLHTDYIAVKKGYFISGEPRITSGSCGIAFYTDKNESSFVSGVRGIHAGISVNEIDWTAPSNGYVRLFSSYAQGGEAYNPEFISNGIVIPKSWLSKEGMDTPGNAASYEFVRDNSSGSGTLTLLSGLRIANNGAMVSIIDDDGALAVHDYLWPMIKSKGLNFGSAICGGLIESGSFEGRQIMDEGKFIEMSKDINTVEIMNHTFSHTRKLGEHNYITQHEDIYKNHLWLNARGVRPTGMVTPWGSYNTDTLKIVAELYKSHYRANGNYNTLEGMRNYEIERLNFGGDGARKDTTINAINDAIANGRWLVIMTHVAGYNDYPQWRSDFEAVCDHITTTGIPCLKPSDAFNLVGNLFETFQGQKMGIDYNIRNY